MKRCILHIGPSKTGSTTLQNFMASNRDALAANGIDYPLLGQGNVANHSDLFRPLLIDSTGRTRGRLETAFPAFVREVEALVAGACGDIMILSCEGLPRLSAKDGLHDEVAKLFSVHGYSVESLAFIRPQFSYFNSKYAQAAKLFRITERFSRYLDRQMREDGSNYITFFRSWYETAAIRFTPVPLTRAETPNGLAHRFFEVCGLASRLDGALDWHDVRDFNISPGPRTVEVLRRLAVRRIKRRYRGDLSGVRNTVQAEGGARGWNEAAFRGVDETLKARIIDHYADANRRFAERFWGRRWQDVFAEEYARPVRSNEYYPGPGEGDDEAAIRDVVRSVERRFATRLRQDPASRILAGAAGAADRLAMRMAT